MPPKQEYLASKFSGWLIVAALILLTYLLSAILAPFLTAAILAYICNPLVNKIAAWKIGRFSPTRTLASLIVMLLLIGLVLLTLLVVVPLVQKELMMVIERLPDYAASLRLHLEPWLLQNFGVSLKFDAAKLQKILTDNWESAGGVLGSVMLTLSTHGMTIIGWLLNLLMVPLVLFYLLRDWHSLLAMTGELIPRNIYSKTKQIAQEIDAVLAEFLRGQLTVIVLMSIFYSVGLKLAGLDMALPIGMLAGVLGFVPYLGVGLGVVLAVISGLLEFNSLSQLIPVLVVFSLGQLLENMWLTPVLVGDRIGLHPVAVIFALLAGGELFGFSGVLLALPASAAIAVALRHARRSYLDSHLYQ
jgi:predicted PurR-regulated permease PerM